jgi:prophage regulatory protein
MPTHTTPPTRLLRLPQVSDLTGLSRTSIYRLERSGAFPRRVRLGLRTVAWHESSVVAWIAARSGVQQ